MSVVDAVTADLEKFGPAVQGSALAATALALAAEIDAQGNSATSKSMCAKALLDLMDRLRELAPPRRETDGVDQIGEARKKRQAAARIARSQDPRSS